MRFKFWKENKINQEFEISDIELKNRFSSYLKNNTKSYLDFGTQVSMFISTPEGLNSVNDVKDFEKIVKVLHDVHDVFLEGNK